MVLYNKLIKRRYILKQISEDFNINLNELLDGEKVNKKRNIRYIIRILMFAILIILSLIHDRWSDTLHVLK